jgi:hypothetical protein
LKENINHIHGVDLPFARNPQTRPVTGSLEARLFPWQAERQVASPGLPFRYRSARCNLFMPRFRTGAFAGPAGLQRFGR